MVSGHEKMLATIHQRMIDKSLGKQPLIDDGSAPNFNVDSTFLYNTMPPESSAAYAHYYGIPMNFYNSQKGPDYYRAHGAVRPVTPTGHTGHGGPVPTGSGALVAHSASPKIIASVPHVLANFS